MKKFYSLFATVAMLMLPMLSWGARVHINVDDADRVLVKVQDLMVEYTSGDNVFEMGNFEHFELKAKEGYKITSVTNGQGDLVQPMSPSYYYIYVMPAGGDEVFYTVKSAGLADTRTASASLTVNGDLNNVKASLKGASDKIELVSGEQTIKFEPEKENILLIEPQNEAIYQVLLDGVSQPTLGYIWDYEVELTDGCAVVINNDVPNGDVNISLSLPAGMQDLIESVEVNEAEVDLTANGFSAPRGADVAIFFNDAYSIDKISVNDQPQDMTHFSGAYMFTAMEDVTIAVEAHKWLAYNFTVEIDNPQAIGLYRGNYYNDDRYELHAGVNELEISEEVPYISYKIFAGYELKSFTDAAGEDYAGVQSLEVKDGDRFTIVTSALSLENTAIVYVDNNSTEHLWFFTFKTASGESVNLSPGYNEVKFNASHTPFNAIWTGLNAVNHAYHNNERLTPEFEGTCNYMLHLADGDVAKIYTKEAPEWHTVDFATNENEAATATIDRVNTAAFGNTADVLTGTEIEFNVPEGYNLLANDVTLPLSEGKHTFTVSENTRFDVKLAQGVINIAHEASADNAIYNLQGMRVNTSEKDLPSGIYIRAGKKIRR